MPLTPAITDKFQKVGLPGSATTLASPGYTIGNASVSVGSTTNHPTDTLYTFAIDRAQTVNGVTSRIPGTYCEFEGIVSGGATIANMTLKYGTAQNYPAGSFTRVYIPVSSNRENALIDGLNQDHNGKGNHKTLTDDNGNAFLTRNQVASAVDSVQVSNAATGGAPRLDAIGSDTTVPLYLGGKGGEPAHSENPEILNNFVVPSTGAIAQSAGLIGTFANITYYINGKRYKKSSIPNKTYTVSKDTYVDIDTSGNVTYVEVTNGATVGMALTANSVRVAKVITSGAAITSVVQTGADPLGVSIKPAGAVGGANIDYPSIGLIASSLNNIPTLSPSGSGTVNYSSNNNSITLRPGIYLITVRASAKITLSSQDATFGVEANDGTTSLFSQSFSSLFGLSASHWPTVSAQQQVTLAAIKTVSVRASTSFGTGASIPLVNTSIEFERVG